MKNKIFSSGRQKLSSDENNCTVLYPFSFFQPPPLSCHFIFEIFTGSNPFWLYFFFFSCHTHIRSKRIINVILPDLGTEYSVQEIISLLITLNRFIYVYYYCNYQIGWSGYLNGPQNCIQMNLVL